MAAAARRGCAALTPVGWRNGKADVVRALIDAHDDLLPPRRRRDISDIAGSSVGVRPDVYCWQPAAWPPFSEEYAIVRGGEETSLKGIADKARNRIDLDPGVCAALRFYLRRMRPASLSYENFEMAEALMVVTHQAEHLKAADSLRGRGRVLRRPARAAADPRSRLGSGVRDGDGASGVGTVVPAAAAGVPQSRVPRRWPARPQSTLERLAVNASPRAGAPLHRHADPRGADALDDVAYDDTPRIRACPVPRSAARDVGDQSSRSRPAARH